MVMSGRLSLLKVAYLYGKCLLTPAPKEFKALKNRHKGEKCYIVALGPSLTIDDLDSINRHGEICFSVNGIFGLFDKTSWRPNYYFMSDPPEDDTCQFMKDFERRKSDFDVCFYNQFFRSKYRDDAIPYKANTAHNVLQNSKCKWIRRLDYRCKFSRDASKFVYDGNTCIISVIQLAYYMGFSRIYLLGADCSSKDTMHHADGVAFEIVDMDGEKKAWDDMQIDYYYMNKDLIKKKIPIEIINVTRGGSLEVFPRMTLEESLGE